MEKNVRKYYLDWWSIRKSSVYGLIALVVGIVVLAGGAWWLWQNSWIIASPENTEAPKDSATIVSFEGNVRIVRVATRATERVTKTTYVQAGDTVQTQADGRAQIRMIDGSVLSVRPNSTVIISDSTSILGGTSVRVKLDDGQIILRTENQPESSNNVVEVKESENKVLAQTEASFNISPDTNRGEIRINRGGVESTVGGKKIVIRENEYLAIDGNKVSSKEKLLKAPDPRKPATSEQIFARGSATSVSFRWRVSGEHQGASFDLQIAQSPFFVSGKMIAEKEALGRPGFSAKALSPGTYFWRVRASIRSGQVSEWSDASKFSIVKRDSSSSIEASDWEVESFGGDIYIIRGVTKPGATVKVLGRETFAKSDGSFRVQASSNGSSIAVGISDEKGNRSQYRISLKTGKVLR